MEKKLLPEKPEVEKMSSAVESSAKGRAIDTYEEAEPSSPADTTEDREGGEEAIHDARVEKIYK